MGLGVSVWGLLGLAIKRLRTDPWLTAGALSGLATAVALTTSVPMYVEAANNKRLRQELGEIEAKGSPAFSFMYHIVYQGDVFSAEQFHAADGYLRDSVPALLRLPLEEATLSVHSEKLGLFPASGEFYSTVTRPLGKIKVGFVRGLGDHAQVIEGDWPAIPQFADEAIEVVITQSKAEALGVHVGEEYTVFRESDRFGRVQFPIRIAGVWVPNEAGERFWFLSPNVYDNILLMPEESYIRYLMPGGESWALYYVAWYQVCDGSAVTTEDVPGLLARMNRVLTRLRGIIPSVGVPVSPEWALLRHARAVNMQSNLLLTLGIPLVAIVLFFVALVSALSTQRRNPEIALLRSRGASVTQILVLVFLESLILGLVALPLGLIGGRFVAHLLGSTRAFLSFEAEGPALSVVITRRGLRTGVIVTIVAMVFWLLPSVRSAQWTIVTFWQRMVRITGRPWWQRSFLDILLLGVAGYGYYGLKHGQHLSFLIGGQGDPLQHPLVLITPALFLCVGVLLFLRIAPHLLKLAAWLSSYLPGSALLLALRHLARSFSQCGGVLSLLTLSIGLSLFTASMARTLDKNLVHRAYYRTGSDLSLQERGWAAQAQGLAELMEGMGAADTAESLDSASADRRTYTFSTIPTDEALQIEGIEGATRVHRFNVMVRLGSLTDQGTLIGIDRLTFPTAAFFRSDFASRPLGELMNSLATHRRGVLVDRAALARYHLNVGDSVKLTLRTLEATAADFRIVGALDLFPTVFDEDFPLFVGSADYVLGQMGGPLPGRLWLAVDPSMDCRTALDQMEDVGFRISATDDARATIEKEQSQLLRVGLFGFLSVGFAAVSMLSVLSLAMHSFASFQQRTIQFGILQAIGLTKGQLEWVFVLEQCTIIVLGVIGGTSLGLCACRLFLPFFQIAYDTSFSLPPLLIEIAWREISKIYTILGITLLLLATGVLKLLKDLRMFEAAKLGTQFTG